MDSIRVDIFEDPGLEEFTPDAPGVEYFPNVDLAESLDFNEDDMAEVMAQLEQGEWAVIGGGAAPLFMIRRAK